MRDWDISSNTRLIRVALVPVFGLLINGVIWGGCAVSVGLGCSVWRTAGGIRKIEESQECGVDHFCTTGGWSSEAKREGTYSDLSHLSHLRWWQTFWKGIAVYSLFAVKILKNNNNRSKLWRIWLDGISGMFWDVFTGLDRKTESEEGRKGKQEDMSVIPSLSLVEDTLK